MIFSHRYKDKSKSTLHCKYDLEFHYLHGAVGVQILISDTAIIGQSHVMSDTADYFHVGQLQAA